MQSVTNTLHLAEGIAFPGPGLLAMGLEPRACWQAGRAYDLCGGQLGNVAQEL